MIFILDSEEIGEAPTFVETLKPRKLRAKKSIELRCVVKGIPIPEIIWCRENEELITDEGEYSTSFDSKTGEAVLTIKKPNYVDCSTYLVRAVNIHGKSECMASISFGNFIINTFTKFHTYRYKLLLYINHNIMQLFDLEKDESGEAPKFVERLKPKVVKANETTELTCLVKGVPTPTISWCRDDEVIIPDESHLLVHVPETGETKLIILHPSDIDESTYTVNATNKFGRAECRANIIVRK